MKDFFTFIAAVAFWFAIVGALGSISHNIGKPATFFPACMVFGIPLGLTGGYYKAAIESDSTFCIFTAAGLNAICAMWGMGHWIHGLKF